VNVEADRRQGPPDSDGAGNVESGRRREPPDNDGGVNVEEEQTRVVIARLARPHASGGYVVGEATIRAEGATFPALKAWILNHGGTPEAPTAVAEGGGLHGFGRQTARAASQYLLPPGTFN
jgi:hypothetical protein